MRRCVLVIVDVGNRKAVFDAARSRRWSIDKTLEVPTCGLRAGLEELKRVARQGSIDAALFDTLELPGVGVLATLREVNELAKLHVELVSAREPWFSTVGTQAKLISWVVGRVDEEHRAKVRLSLARVRAEGRPLGRPRALVPVETVLTMRAAGASLRSIARATKLGVSTIQRFLAAHDQVAKGQKI